MRVWSLITAMMMAAGLTGCQSLRETHPVKSSGDCFVIQSVPEPGLTSFEEHHSSKVVRGWRQKVGKTTPTAPDIPPMVEGDPGQFSAKTPDGTEHGFGQNPKTDVPTAKLAVTVNPTNGPYRTVTEANVRQSAMQASRPAQRLEWESIIPAANSEKSCTTVDQFLRQARDLAAQGERIKASGEAAVTFYQLADAEGQAELLRLGIDAFDKVRAEAAKPREINGRRVPVPPEMLVGLDRQRADFLKTAELLALASANFNIDLKKQMGLSGHTTDRLYPSGEFGIDVSEIDVEASVQKALAQRPDLQLLRLAYFELNEDTLPAVREQLKQTIGLMAPPRLSNLIAARHPHIRSILEHFGKKPDLDPTLVHELAVRKAQLHDLICEKEREAADQVRKAAAMQTSMGQIVGAMVWKADSLKKQVEGMKSNKEATMLEWYKARAEVIGAVMAWHQARVKLSMAMGE